MHSSHLHTKPVSSVTFSRPRKLTPSTTLNSRHVPQSSSPHSPLPLGTTWRDLTFTHSSHQRFWFRQAQLAHGRLRVPINSLTSRETPSLYSSHSLSYMWAPFRATSRIAALHTIETGHFVREFLSAHGKTCLSTLSTRATYHNPILHSILYLWAPRGGTWYSFTPHTRRLLRRART
jgi:hypothetical protein